MEKKRRNKVRIAQFIRYKKYTSKPEIADGLGISMPTVLQNVKELIEEGIVEETGEFESTGGRKAKALSIAAGQKLAVGLDITKHHLSMVLLDLKGEMIEKKRIRKPFENSFEYYRQLSEELDRFIRESEASSEKILGIGISMPGILDQEAKMLTRSHVLQVDHVGFQTIGQFIRYPSAFENDANSAALAELAHRERDAVYLSLSNSVGGSIYLNGRIYPGGGYKSAEFGHMIIEPGGRRCYCGKKGCMDAYCSARVLSVNTDDNLELFFQELEQGNPNIEAVWAGYLDALAVSVSNLRMAFDCDIMLGGYVGGFLEPYMVEIGRRVSEYNPFEQDTVYLKNSRCKIEAAAVGGAMKFIDSFFEESV